MILDNERQKYSDDDVYSLRELLTSGRKYLKYLFSNILIIGLFILFFGGIAGFIEQSEDITYSSTLTFMVSEEESSSIGGFGSVLGQLGLGNARGENNLMRMVELGKSKRIVTEVLFDSCIVDGKGDLIINHIIQEGGFQEEWENSEDEKLSGFKFRNVDLRQFEIHEQFALKDVYYWVVGYADRNERGAVSINVSDDTGILSIDVTSKSEDLAVALANSQYNHLSGYYVDKKTMKHRKTFNEISFKSDSVKREIVSLEQNLAYLGDRSIGIIRNKDRILENRYRRDLQVLTIMYGEMLKNREAADFVLRSETPFFQVIDKPSLPANKNVPSVFKMVIIGGFLGFLTSVLILLCIKVISEALSSK